MMDWGRIVTGDHARSVLQAAAVVGVDQLVSRKVPKLKWYWRAGLVIGTAAVMILRKGRAR